MPHDDRSERSRVAGTLREELEDAARCMSAAVARLRRAGRHEDAVRATRAHDHWVRLSADLLAAQAGAQAPQQGKAYSTETQADGTVVIVQAWGSWQ